MKDKYDFINEFPPLGHPDHHFNKYPNHPWLKSVKDIYIWIKNNLYIYYYYIDNGYPKFKEVAEKECEDLIIVNEDFTLSFKLFGEDVNLIDFFGLNIELIKKVNFIPIQFRFVKQFKSNKNQIKSLVGTPYNVGGMLFSNNVIKDFNGIENTNIKLLDLYSNKIINFKGMNKKIEFLSMGNNPIKTLSGFCGSNSLNWWQREWCDKTSLNLLMGVANKVEKIYCEKVFENQAIQKEKDNLEIINIVHLRSLKNIRSNNKSIEKTLLKSSHNKKRKL